MIAPAPILPLIYSTKRYQVGKNRIEVLIYTRWPGMTREKAHPSAPAMMFLGYATVKGTHPNGQKMARELCFPISAETIFEAAQNFDEQLEKMLKDINRPDIVLPPGFGG